MVCKCVRMCPDKTLKAGSLYMNKFCILHLHSLVCRLKVTVGPEEEEVILFLPASQCPGSAVQMALRVLFQSLLSYHTAVYHADGELVDLQSRHSASCKPLAFL